MRKSPDDPEPSDWLRAGDREAFERFYRKQAPRLLNFLRRSVPDSKAAEDIAHEAFLQLWQRRNGFHPSRGSARAYLFGIAARRAADWWRHQESRPASPLDRPAARADSPILVAEVLEQIGPDKRSLLWLREVEGYSYQELAEMLKIPLGTVQSRLFAAREQFRHIWRGEKSSEKS